MKYIMWQVGEQKIPIIFPEILVHADIQKGTQRAIFTMWRDGGSEGMRPEVVSAGFIPGMVVSGVDRDSESIGVKSNPDDERVINTYAYEHGRESVMSGVHNMVKLRMAQMLLDDLKGGQNANDEG